MILNKKNNQGTGGICLYLIVIIVLLIIPLWMMHSTRYRHYNFSIFEKTSLWQFESEAEIRKNSSYYYRNMKVF